MNEKTTSTSNDEPGDSKSGSKPTPQQIASQKEELEAIQARCEVLEARIVELQEGEHQWTETNLSPLKQEIADLQATLREMTPNLSTQVASLREELTQQLQELRREVKPEPSSPITEEHQKPPVETPPKTPPQSEPPKSADAEGQEKQKPKGKRVV